MLGPEEPAQLSVVPCALPVRLFPPTSDRRTNFLTVEETTRGRRIRGRTQIWSLLVVSGQIQMLEKSFAFP